MFIIKLIQLAMEILYATIMAHANTMMTILPSARAIPIGQECTASSTKVYMCRDSGGRVVHTYL